MRGKFASDGLIYAAKVDLPLDRAPLLREGEILVVRSGAYTGDSAMVTNAWVGSAPGYDLRVSPVSAHPAYIAYCLLSTATLDQVDLAKSRAAQPHLNAEDLGDITVFLPPREEQRRVADFLDAETARIDRLLAARNRQLVAMDELAASRVSAMVPSRSKASFVRLGYLAVIQSGVTVDSNREPGNDAVTLPYLRVANVQDGHVDLESVTEITLPRSVARSTTLRYGDVLMTEGGDLDKLGRGTVWLDDIKNCLHQNHVFAVRPDQRRLTPEYLALLTRTAHARSYFESTGTKTTNLASTSSSKIRDFRVPLVNLSKQERICQEMDAWLKDIAKVQSTLRRQSALLAERRQALITAAVMGGISV
jgi:type I restriction enzyme S subunit